MKKKDIDLIEKLNLENWIENNIALVQYIARKPRASVEIHGAKRFGKTLALTKRMNRGVDFGVFNSTSRFRGDYSLTDEAEKYLDERQGDNKEAARAGTD